MSFPHLNYVSVLPKMAGSPDQELENCLEQLAINGGIPLKINVFVNSVSEENFDIQAKRLTEIIFTRFKGHCPAFCILSQPPKVGSAVAVEAILEHTGETVLCLLCEGIPYVVLEKAGNKFLWASGLSAKTMLAVDEGAEFAFEKMQTILAAEGLTFDHIVRQWNYIPQICFVKKDNGLLLQHYQLFNEVRHSFYQRYRKRNCYPAATGIGTRFGNFTLDFFAYQGSEESLDLKIESPLQANPYQYGQNVLVGSGLETGLKKHAPEFERARILINAQDYWLIVSGTASIEGEATTDTENLTRQTNSTIRNIESLVSPTNLILQYPQLRFSNPEYVGVRVYVKDRADISLVEEIVRKKFENIPVTVVQAEICRCDLLVEIEAELKGQII